MTSSVQKENKGRVVIVSGPSGVGKSTICKEVVRRVGNVYLSVSVTTRKRAENEVDGRDYWFVSKEEFEERINKGMLLEYAEVFGNLYGTPKEEAEKALREGKTVILEIDVQGARQVRMIYPDVVMIFIFPPNQKELAERMKNRGRDEAKAAAERLSMADVEIAAGWQYYQHIVINDDLNQAVQEVISTLDAECSAVRRYVE